uniref:CD180 molecule n=1 Tax=Salvator merianae TaxID=96440 RepID=A0A8D0B5I3_SALMN
RFLQITFSGELVANRSYSCEGLGLTEIPKLPLMTKVLDFSFNFLISLQNSTFSMLKNLVHLDLTRCQTNWIYESAFESNDRLENIILVGNNLMFIADTAFRGLHFLKYLDLTQTGLTSLTFIPMQDLGNLETLILGNNYIQLLELPPHFPTRKLKYLDLQTNFIHKISAKGIDALKQVQNLTLVLKGNDITQIDVKAFESMFFYTLDFGTCVNIPVILEGLQGVRTVVLWLGTFNDKAVPPISSTMLQGICNLSVDNLNLQYHHFSDFSADTFKCLGKLQKLDLTYTYLTEIPSDLPEMNALKELNLNKNSFMHLCNISSSAFPHLTHLYLRGNSESLDLGSGCLESLSELQYLDLSSSHIENLDCCSKELHGLTSLQYLSLSYNKKLVLHDAAFKNCANLKVLDLASTQIFINAPQGPFFNLHFLQVLNLSNTQIDLSIRHILKGLESLTVLNLSGNKFESGTILKDNLFQEVPNLEVLTLTSCKLLAIEIKAFSVLKRLKHVDLSHNVLTAFNSDVFFSLKNIYLNFSSNRIHVVPPHTLSSLSGQTVINLSYNPLECTCSNTELITWYKQNTDKIEDSEKTVCAKPKSLVGVKLLSVNLFCGYSTAQVILITFAVITVIVLTFLLITRCLKRMYQRI